MRKLLFFIFCSFSPIYQALLQPHWISYVYNACTSAILRSKLIWSWGYNNGLSSPALTFINADRVREYRPLANNQNGWRLLIPLVGSANGGDQFEVLFIALKFSIFKLTYPGYPKAETGQFSIEFLFFSSYFCVKSLISLNTHLVFTALILKWDIVCVVLRKHRAFCCETHRWVIGGGDVDYQPFILVTSPYIYDVRIQ